MVSRVQVQRNKGEERSFLNLGGAAVIEGFTEGSCKLEL